MQTIKIVVCVAIFMFINYLHLDNLSAFTDILTFLSITIGFSITALSIIANSSFAKELYQQEASDDNSKTLLHQLVGKFERSTVCFVAVITLILVLFFIEPIDFMNHRLYNLQISIKSILGSTVWFLTFLSVWLFIDLLKTFSKFVIQSAKRQ